MNTSVTTKELIQLLDQYVTPHKKEVIDNVLAQRTRHLTVVLEDLYHPHNISAVIRTCDCFGVQDLYITQRLHEYDINPNVVRGASKWVTLNKFERQKNTSVVCFEELKSKGYRLVGTTPDRDSVSMEMLDISLKTALVFGTELGGLSEYARDEVEEMVHVPMYGFTESFNISVSAALLLQHLMGRLKTMNLDWGLTDEEKDELKFEWYQRIVKRSDLHLKKFFEERGLSHPINE